MVDYYLPELPDPKLRGKGPVTEWYNGRSIFITGASGFMGKVLVEKLLYQCLGLKKIYILLRSKRGRTPEQRVEDMWKLPMFHRLQKNPEFIKKIVPVHGDILTEGLGLSTAHRQMLVDDVSVVFHCAATLKLEAPLKESIAMNTAGTEKVIALAKQIKNLAVFIHLSTAFCSADIAEMDEKNGGVADFGERFYPTADKPRDVMQVVNWMKEDALIQATPAIIAPHPNTYTYAKRLAETLVFEEYPNMNTVIVRPSIVIPAGIEPLPGWVDSLNGPMGLVVGAGKGVIRSMHVKASNRAQTVPVDVAISALLVIAWKHGSQKVKPPEIPVYNMTNDGQKRMTWGEVLEKGRVIAYKYPFEGTIWYPDGDIRSSRLVHDIYCFFFHWIPAYFIDFMMLIFMQKRFMIRLMNRISLGLELLQFFTTREWIFESKNFLGLNEDMTELDRKIFMIDFNVMTVEEYFTIALLGARQYLMKENLKTIPRCRIVQHILWVVHKFFVYGFYWLLLWTVCQWSSTVQGGVDTVGLYVKNVPVIGSLLPTTPRS